MVAGVGGVESGTREPLKSRCGILIAVEKLRAFYKNKKKYPPRILKKKEKIK
jgi:hypothetical protein